MKDKIIQVSGFGVANTNNTQCDYILIALTESGKVLMAYGDGAWRDISPEQSEGAVLSAENAEV